MSVGWDSLPLVPLRCVLEHLSVEDALAATSTCRHWRSAVLLYEGRRELLRLGVKNLERSMFLARIFKKHTRRLHIYIDSTGELDSFMSYILPLFFDTLKLNELAFIGPSYILQNKYVPIPELKRIIVESLIFKHMLSLQRLILIGCEMATPKNDNDRFTHKHVEYYSRALSFSTQPSLDDTILSRCNVGRMLFSALKHITMECEYLSSGTLSTLTQLPQLSLLTVNIAHKRPLATPFEWPPQTLNVAVNIISVPTRRFNEIIEQVLVDGLMLVSLKVMFCETLNVQLLSHVSRQYKNTLQELVWVDSPAEETAPLYRVVKFHDVCVNDILMLCWQCVHLRRLVIHGYWLWQYDVLGIVRLRSSLEQLEVSAVYGRQNHFGNTEDGVLRVLASDSLTLLDPHYVKKINEHTDFKWAPCSYENLHPALKLGATPAQRAHYVMTQAATVI